MSVKRKQNGTVLTVFNRLGEMCGEYLKKGAKIYVEGKLQTRKWQGQDGQDRYTTEVVVSEIQMMDKGQGQQGQSQNQTAQQSNSPTQQSASQPQQSWGNAPQAAQNAQMHQQAPAYQPPTSSCNGSCISASAISI